MRAGNQTRTQILDVAERLVQTRGYNAFSYADVAKELQITTATLHYYFPGKAELGDALVRRYSERFRARLREIDEQEPGAAQKLDAFVDIYSSVLQAGRMCLCGMLAADYETLPADLRADVQAFFDDTEEWLRTVLAAGAAEGSLQPGDDPVQTARAILGSLEGAMLVARIYGDPGRFDGPVRQVLAELRAGEE